MRVEALAWRASFRAAVEQQRASAAIGAQRGGRHAGLACRNYRQPEKSRRERRRQQPDHTWTGRVAESSATLIVAPDHLVEHWHSQVIAHVNFAFLGRSAADAVFCNRDAGLMPTPAALAKRWIVITSTTSMRRGAGNFAGVLWQRVVVDEGHSVGGSSRSGDD